MHTHVTYIDHDDIISEICVYIVCIFVVNLFHRTHNLFYALLHFVCTSFKMYNKYIYSKTTVEISKIWYFIGKETREANKWRKFQRFKKVWVSNWFFTLIFNERTFISMNSIFEYIDRASAKIPNILYILLCLKLQNGFFLRINSEMNSRNYDFDKWITNLPKNCAKSNTPLCMVIFAWKLFLKPIKHQTIKQFLLSCSSRVKMKQKRREIVCQMNEIFINIRPRRF